MIGAGNSPMSMFTGGGNEAFQRGMMIGNANSPFSSVGEALRNTIDKYNAHLGAQQEQANKLEQIRTQYDLEGQNQLAIQQAKNAAENTAAPIRGFENGFDIANPPTQIIGGQKVAFIPEYKGGKIAGVKTFSPTPPNITSNPETDFSFDTVGQFSKGQPGNQVPTQEAIAPVNPFQIGMDAGAMNAPPPMSMANPATAQVPSTNASEALIQKNMQAYGRSREEVIMAMKKKGLL